MIARFRLFKRAPQIAFCSRRFSTQEPKERSLNVIQQLPSYQKALEYVVEEKYD